MRPQRDFVCPRCDYPLVPVFAIEGTRRKVIALSCPEPYCDHMQMLPKERAAEFQHGANDDAALKRAAN